MFRPSPSCDLFFWLPMLFWLPEQKSFAPDFQKIWIPVSSWGQLAQLVHWLHKQEDRSPPNHRYLWKKCLKMFYVQFSKYQIKPLRSQVTYLTRDMKIPVETTPYLSLLQSWRYFLLTKRADANGEWTGRSCKLNSLLSLSLGLPPPMAGSRRRCNSCGTWSSSHEVNESLSTDFYRCWIQSTVRSWKVWVKYPSCVSFYIYTVIPLPVACFSNTVFFTQALFNAVSMGLLPQG